MPKRAVSEKQLPAFDLKNMRIARKLSQMACAGILCTTQGSITRWEKDGSMPLIYRKYWEAYWKIIDMEAAKKPVRKRKAMSEVTTQ